MKKIISLSTTMLCASVLLAQTYPDPEFNNEVYYLKKDNPYTLVRLEKSSAKMENKVNVIKGSSFGYVFDGKSSPVRFSNGSDLYFVFSNGASASSSSNSKSDSTMRANGVDPNMFSGMAGDDPSSMITLYKVNVDGDSRKIYMQKTGGYFSSHKMQSSDKYTFSLKKIREGYWVLVIDKPLPKGEYAFSLMAMMNASDMTNSHVVFAFGID